MTTENDDALDLELLAKERENLMNPPEPMMPGQGGGQSAKKPASKPTSRRDSR
jgi:hypothetical protein